MYLFVCLFKWQKKQVHFIWAWDLTVVGHVGHLEAFAAVALVGLELDPQLAGARGEGDGPLIRLARLIGSDGGGQG